MAIFNSNTIDQLMQNKKGRINEVFDHAAANKKKGLLNVYCTAGFPELNSTRQILRALQDNRTDMIELGIPYSDPLADGPVIQQSSAIALANGMTISRLFEQLKDFRDEIDIPVILMGYMNPVMQYGFDRFCKEAADLGIDGLILPDLPEHEFESSYGPIIKKYGLDFIFLITPETSDKRIRKLDQLSSGFLYAVSSSSTTGQDKNQANVTAYLQRLEAMELENPIIVGFGIKDRETFENACRNSRGAIIGTAYIQSLQKGENPEASTKNFLTSILG